MNAWLLFWAVIATMYGTVVATLSIRLLVCAWLDRRDKRRWEKERSAFANTQPIELVEEAEAALEGEQP